MMGFATGHLTADTYFQPLQPSAADLLCSTNYLSAAPTAYINDHLPHFLPSSPPAENMISIDQYPQFHFQSQYSCSSYAEKRSGGKQSMAARERRRKITAKTQELGKLIPGAQKMNTAQMLQAASKYVKFLQAQLALLQQMASFHDPQGMKQGKLLEAEELPVLLASPAIQEKLYTQEKCLAPKHFLQKLASIQAVDLQLL